METEREEEREEERGGRERGGGKKGEIVCYFIYLFCSIRSPGYWQW